MNRIFLTFILLSFFTHYICAQDKIILKNGSILMVDSIELKDQSLIFQFLSKKQTIPSSEINSLHLGPGYIVSNYSDILYEVTSPTIAVPGFIFQINNQKFLINEIKAIFANTQLVDAKKDLIQWDGNFDIGYHNQSGNVNQNKLHYFAKFERVTVSNGIHIELFGRNGNDSAIGRNEAGNLKSRYCIKHQNKTWQFIELKYDYNKILGVGHHHNLSIGTGWDLLKTKTEYILLSTGIGSDKLQRQNGVETSFMTGVFILDFKKSLFDDNYLEGNLNMYPRLNDMSNLKGDSRISLVHPLDTKSSIKMTLQQNYLSEALLTQSKFDRHLYMSYNRKF